VDAWLKAGQYAAARQAHLEATRHFERGLVELAALPEGSARDKREIDLQLAQGLSLFTAKGITAVETEQAYNRAHELAERQGDQRQLFTAVFGVWQAAAGAGRISDCRRLSNRLQQLAAETADEELSLQAHHSAWTTCMFAGEPATAREHCEAGRRVYDPERHRLHRQLYGSHDPGVCARYVGAHAEVQLGYPDTALASSGEALALDRADCPPVQFGDCAAAPVDASPQSRRAGIGAATVGGGASPCCRATTWLRDGTRALARCRLDGARSVGGGSRLFA
jgi:hypothetical protein